MRDGLCIDPLRCQRSPGSVDSRSITVGSSSIAGAFPAALRKASRAGPRTAGRSRHPTPPRLTRSAGSRTRTAGDGPRRATADPAGSADRAGGARRVATANSARVARMPPGLAASREARPACPATAPRRWAAASKTHRAWGQADATARRIADPGDEVRFATDQLLAAKCDHPAGAAEQPAGHQPDLALIHEHAGQIQIGLHVTEHQARHAHAFEQPFEPSGQREQDVTHLGAAGLLLQQLLETVRAGVRVRGTGSAEEENGRASCKPSERPDSRNST